jgi:hypothetical protein
MAVMTVEDVIESPPDLRRQSNLFDQWPRRALSFPIQIVDLRGA